MKNFKIIKFNTIPSTNKHAAFLAKKGESEGTVVFSKEQTGGKGRGKNKWVSPEGNLYFSIIVRPKLSGEEIKYFPIVAGYSTTLVLAKYNLEPQLKWPNDIKISGKKIGGILIETEITGENIDFMIVGIGLNVNTDPGDIDKSLKNRASSISKFLDKKIDLDKLFNDLLSQFKNTYNEFISQKTHERRNWIREIWEIWKEPGEKNKVSF